MRQGERYVSIQPVKRVRAYEDIVRQLADMIRRGEIKPGDRLPPERELAQAFGVGRPTLRQALTVLTEAGVVEVLPGSGVYLRKPIGESSGSAGNAMAMVLMTENKTLYDILELRVAIESEAAYLAALRREPEHVEKLKAAYQALEHAFHTNRTPSQEDYQFHFTIAEATGNPVFLKVMASLADLFIQQFRDTARSLYHEPDRVLANCREHQDILMAILDQRADDARAAMMKHLRRVAERLQRAEQMKRDQGAT